MVRVRVKVRDMVIDRDKIRIEIRRIEKEPDVQMAARVAGGMPLYAKATEPHEFG